MSNSLPKSRKRWNDENYKQLNIALRPELIDSFRNACTRNKTSMRSTLVAFMSEYAFLPIPADEKDSRNDFSTRPKRRTALPLIINHLERMRDSEVSYMENMPANLQGSSRYDAAESAVSFLDEAILSLENVYSN